MLGNSQFFKIEVYLPRTKNYKKSQPFLGKVMWASENSAFSLHTSAFVSSISLQPSDIARRYKKIDEQLVEDKK